MSVHNQEIAQILEDVADLLELEGADAFRVRAYRNAARTVRGLGIEAAAMLAAGEDLTRQPGIGTAIATKIAEIVKTSKLAALEELRRAVPPVATELLTIPGLGPKRVHAIYHELDIQTPEQLRRAVLDGRLQRLPGFGPKVETAIRETLEHWKPRPKRFLRTQVAPTVEDLIAHMKAGAGVRRVVVAGSFRRARDTVGDIDLLVTASNGRAAADWFTQFEAVQEVVALGSKRATVVLRNGLQVDLRVVADRSYGAALNYFTVSKAHNIALRRLAQERGLKINEYGVFRGDNRIAGETEESVFACVDLPFITPELRENRGEIEAAREGQLPRLIEFGDLRGDLHAHTKATDGQNTIREMAAAARERGFEYIAITEHSRRVTVAHGLTPKRLLKQIEEIDRITAERPGITVLKGIEVDILEDGKLDLPDTVLAKLDLVIGAVHSRFNLSREKQTERIIRAMDNPHLTILAHPTGRLLRVREPYDVDMARIVQAARQRGCYLELNASPDRLDLQETHCQMAKAEGVLISIDSDAHRTTGFDNLRLGVSQARRGWLEKDDVLNTRPLRELRTLLN